MFYYKPAQDTAGNWYVARTDENGLDVPEWVEPVFVACFGSNSNAASRAARTAERLNKESP